MSSNERHYHTTVSLPIWMYWENQPPYEKPPDFIQLCFETVLRNASPYFHVIRLGPETIGYYIPQLNQLDLRKRTALSRLKIAQRVDYYRMWLLYLYGGLWLDSDIILLRSPKLVYDSIRRRDRKDVFFGCTGLVCPIERFERDHHYGKPSNQIIGAVKNSPIIRECIARQHELLDTIFERNISSTDLSYFSMGKHILWYVLSLHPEFQRNFIHLSPQWDGTRDVNGYWVSSKRLFGTKPIPYPSGDNDTKYFVPVYFSDMTPYQKQLSRSELLSGQYEVSKYFRIALPPNTQS